MSSRARVGDWVDSLQTIHVRPSNRHYQVTRVRSDDGSVDVQAYDCEGSKARGGYTGIWDQFVVVLPGPECNDRCMPLPESRLPLTADTSSILGLDQALGVDVNALVDAFRYAESDPLRALAAVAAARHAADAVESHALRAARRKRMPWAKLAAPLGITRQALQKRHPDLD